MKWLPTALITVGASTVLGILRPWQDSGNSAILIGLIIWVILPMMVGWMFLRRNLFPITRILLRVFVTGLLLIWGLSAVVAIVDSSFDGNFGLLFWPALEWFALIVIFTVWALERTGRKNKNAKQVTVPNRSSNLNSTSSVRGSEG